MDELHQWAVRGPRFDPGGQMARGFQTPFRKGGDTHLVNSNFAGHATSAVIVSSISI